MHDLIQGWTHFQSGKVRDLYRDAKLLDMARKSYNKALEHGPDISHGFAYTALAYIAYEQGSSSSFKHDNFYK